MPRRAVVAVLSCLLASAAAAPAAHAVSVDEVDPFIGSANGGNTWPGAVRPFGMLSWSPTTTKGDQTSAGGANGYADDATRIRGFALTHVNGAGCNPGAQGDVPIMPVTGPVQSSPSADTTDATYAADFSHDAEQATPGRYGVRLGNGVGVDLAATDRAGVGTFRFPAGQPASVLVRTSNSLNGSEDATTTVDAPRRRITGSVLTGGFCGRRANGGTPNPNRRSFYRLHFVIEFDKPVTGTGAWRDGQLLPGATTASGGEGYLTGPARAGRGSGAYASFAPGQAVTARVGISYVSLAGAERNLRGEVPRGATVARVAREGRRAWNRQLGRVAVGGGDPARRTAFTTALYHAFLQPNVVSDVDGRYAGMDGRVHQVRGGQRAQLSNFSGWDQYRAHVQLLAALQPRVAADFAQSLLNYARQNDGVFDRWVLVNGATHVMNGDPTAATLATFAAMGVRGWDARAAFDGLYEQATVPRPEGLSTAGCPGQCVGQRPNLADHLRLRYAAQDVCNCWGGAAETLEMAVADDALGRWARQLGRTREARELRERGGWWRNTFDPGTRFVRPRNADGSWAGPFDPASDVGFAQGSAATYTWMVPQDPQGLAAAMGGPEEAITRLDGFFKTPDGAWSLKAGDPLRYDATNEPGIHVPWLYAQLGAPVKTQETVRAILDGVYGTGPDGLPGNDDLGTMSAWYVWAALGLYPRTPGSDELVVSAPLFERVTLRPAGRPPVRITTDGTGPYVQRARLGGRRFDRTVTDGRLLRRGGTLAVGLGETPNPGWGDARR